MSGLITFDLDGTLVASALSIARCANFLLRHQGRVEMDIQTLLPLVGVGTAKMFDTLKLTVDRAFYHDIYLEKFAQDVQPFEDALPAIHLAKSLGYKVAIVTNRDQILAEKIAELVGLTKNVHGVFGVHDGIRPKPDGDLLAFASLSLGEKLLVHIGDHQVDIEAASRLSVMPCLIHRTQGITIPPGIVSGTSLVEIVSQIDTRLTSLL